MIDARDYFYTLLIALALGWGYYKGRRDMRKEIKDDTEVKT